MKKEESSYGGFLNPKSIALFGASDHNEKVGGILARKIIKTKIKFIPVNPNHESLFGAKCYKNILDYKGEVDLAVIAIPSLFVIGALNECGRKGVKNIVIISAGFSEIGNLKGEKEIFETAKKYKMRILGPNCFGVCNPYKNLDMTFSMSMPKKGDIAFISQSGALWSYIADFNSGISNSFGFSGFVSLGNMGDLEFADFIDYFSKDKKTKSIVLYIEKLKDGRKFVNLCKKCKKKIYAVKAGSSEEGSKAAVSHTGSLATDYAVYKGIMKQAGVILCDSLLEAFEKASGKKLITNLEPSPLKIGKRVFILTNAGGAGALMSDYLSAKGFELKYLPFDLLGTASGSDYYNALEKLKSKDFYDSIIAILTPQSMSEIKKTAEVIQGFKELARKSIIALFLGDKNKTMKEANMIFESSGVPYFNTLEEARRDLTH